jgi:eukaryotic-like serine/threonine-protein kinase
LLLIMVWDTGKVLRDGRYTIEEVIGHGRLSITYLAKDQHGDRIVIKVPNDEAIVRADFERLQERFVKEAFKLQKCEHPNIVKVFDPFQEAGLWCIPMEYIAGMRLDKRDRPKLPEAEAITYVKQIGEALGVLHSQNLIHRDVNPNNVMIRVRNGVSEAVLIDFGLARDFSTNASTTVHTGTDELPPSFKAPELYIAGGDRGSYTDLYALGAILYELVTGQVAPSAIERKAHPQPLSFPGGEVNQSVVKAIESAMTMQPTDRPESVAEWLIQLTEPPLTEPPPPPKQPINWTTVTAIIGAIAGLITAIAALVTAFQPKEAAPTKTTQPTKTEQTK